MGSGLREHQIRQMDGAQLDLVARFRLETEFFQDHVRHTRYVGKEKSRDKKVEDWSNCGELGKGGFGVVHKQIQKTTGHARAVKAINKRLPTKLDSSRELLVMAVLVKYPSFFVEFLGWFEEPETLYIAMEYLEKGDLTKHIGTPLRQETVQIISKQILEGLEVMHREGIAHRDLKPANIFVVSTSPIRVKLGDFGISKRIRAQDTTTFHTQVSTPVYGAPEVLGLDPYSETSVYTNSVDIWSLGCVVYELLVGEKLFVSEGQVYLCLFASWPFLEDKLNELSPPTSDAGISLIKSMLAIQPRDRPTAAGALGHEWLVGLKGDDGDSEDDKDETTRIRGRNTRSRKSENKLATLENPKKRSEGNPITQEDTVHTPGDANFEAYPGSQRGSDPTPRKSTIDISAMTLPGVASVEGSLIRTPPRGSEPALHSPRATRSGGTGALRKEWMMGSIAQTCPQSSTPNTRLNPYMKRVANKNWINRRPPASNPPTPDLHRGNGVQ
ncbi:kinase-like protein [Tuber magnatum]|uniref:Kinase-like protein n=1 Tax=Tuber magnatum TaxID=42249 RepID=A0A317SF01_9PEZI|nr:kinase-like protein [Tuber magnatum]